ncbi:hypothetical protein ACIPSE_33140 [Streptomyces sp. NPDC090106]|uniref:hypothetical protein n=1 Tax=Streptomyces sp. NPDC090106 TaxID=3365946 RepID=UPI003812CFF9
MSGTRSRDHLNFSVLDARHHIAATLASWSEIVVEELGVTAPERSVPRLAGFLSTHLQWLAAQVPAADFADETAALVAQLRTTVDPEPGTLHTLIRNCVVDGCAGTISASPGHAGASGNRSIACSAGHSWETHEWLTLRRLMERDRKGVTA